MGVISTTHDSPFDFSRLCNAGALSFPKHCRSDVQATGETYVRFLA